MNLKTVLGLMARHALTAVGGALVAKGYVSADEAHVLVNVSSELIVGAVMTAGGLVWSYVQKKRAQQQ